MCLNFCGNSTGLVSRADGPINGVCEITVCEGIGLTVVLGVEKTFPLESKASNLANCSAHWSDISFSWSDVTN